MQSWPWWRKAVHAHSGFALWQLTAQSAAIVIAVALAYLPALRAGFVWDDEQLVTRNPLLRTFSGLVEIWSGGRTADYFPITNTVFWIESHLFGQAAAGYHAVNIVLQAGNALLVWLVLRRLSVPGAWLAGLIFGIHPVHAESVAWISELKNLLSMFFALLSVLCFFEIEEKRVLGATAAYVASLFFFLFALLSKTQVVFVPIVLLLCAWWRGKRGAENLKTSSFRREMIRTWPFFLMVIALGLVTIWFQNRGIGDEEIIFGSFSRRFANAGMAVWWYMGKLFLPVRLMAIYPKWRFDSPRLLEWLPLMALLGLLVILWQRRKRGTRGAFFALAYFVVALLPALGFLRMAYLRSGTLVADHHQYFADVSLIAFFSAGIVSLWARPQTGIKIATLGVVMLLLGAMGAYSSNRAEIYRGEETLWQDNLSKNPDAWQAHARMGLRLFQQEKYPEAVYHWQRTVQLKPELAEHHNLLGLVYCRLNRFDEGIAEYREALQLEEARSSTAKSIDVATIRTNLANALTITANKLSDSTLIVSDEAMQRYEEAIREYKEALKLEPQHPAIHRNLGVLLARLGRYDEAIEHLRAVLQVVPDEPLARETLNAIEAQRR
jgi:tetratricopeptide (TPR) repeat protein